MEPIWTREQSLEARRRSNIKEAEERKREARILLRMIAGREVGEREVKWVDTIPHVIQAKAAWFFSELQEEGNDTIRKKMFEYFFAVFFAAEPWGL